MTRYSRPFAISLVATGCLVIFAGLAVMSFAAAVVIATGVALVALGLLAIEVPQP